MYGQKETYPEQEEDSHAGEAEDSVPESGLVEVSDDSLQRVQELAGRELQTEQILEHRRGDDDGGGRREPNTHRPGDEVYQEPCQIHIRLQDGSLLTKSKKSLVQSKKKVRFKRGGTQVVL